MARLLIFWLSCNFAVTAWGKSSAPQFAVKELKIGRISLKVEVAGSPEKHEHGLMFRQELKEGTGMIFIFKEERVQSFWMKNTFVPLDAGFFDKQKRLVDIQQMQPVGSVMEIPRTYTSKAPAQYVLEVPQGWFARKKIERGAKFRLD